ncbi:MAG: hypothetical protein U0U66_01255 [Cytophagaceae bacterium]
MAFNIFRKSTKEVKGYLMEYLRVLNQEGKDHPAEVQKIIDIAEKNGMRGMDINTLIADIDAHKIKDPKDDNERFEFMKYLVQLVVNDDQFSDSEMDFLKEMGVSVGYPIMKVPQIILELYNGFKYEESVDDVKAKIDQLLKD